MSGLLQFLFQSSNDKKNINSNFDLFAGQKVPCFVNVKRTFS